MSLVLGTRRLLDWKVEGWMRRRQYDLWMLLRGPLPGPLTGVGTRQRTL